MRRPKFLENQDTVQDAIDEHGSDGVTIKQLMSITTLPYLAVQQAAFTLRNKRRIDSETRSRVLHFFPTSRA